MGDRNVHHQFERVIRCKALRLVHSEVLTIHSCHSYLLILNCTSRERKAHNNEVKLLLLVVLHCTTTTTTTTNTNHTGTILVARDTTVKQKREKNTEACSPVVGGKPLT